MSLSVVDSVSDNIVMDLRRNQKLVVAVVYVAAMFMAIMDGSASH